MQHVIGSLVKLFLYMVGAVALVFWLVLRTILVLFGNLVMAVLVGVVYFIWLSVGEGLKPSVQTLLLIITGEYVSPQEIEAEQKREELKERVVTNNPRPAAYNQSQLLI